MTFSNRSIEIMVFLVIWIFTVAIVAASKVPAHLHPGEVAYLLSRGVLACVVFFWLMPRLLVRRWYKVFIAALFLLMFIFGSIEEGVLEPFFFPETRGKEGWTFIGVYYFTFEVAPFLAAVLIVRLLLDQHKAQRAMDLLRAETNAHELRFLKSQINPHMLFNTLNNIYAYVLTTDERAPKLVKRLADFLRYVLYEANADSLPLHKEIMSLRNYLAIQEMAIKDRGEVVFCLEGSIEGKWVQPLILANVVENCFKHSLDSQVRDIVIQITLVIQPSKLQLRTKNSFLPPPSTSRSDLREKGIGLKNLRRRLALRFGKNFLLNTHVSDGFFHTELCMPLETSPLELSAEAE